MRGSFVADLSDYYYIFSRVTRKIAFETHAQTEIIEIALDNRRLFDQNLYECEMRSRNASCDFEISPSHATATFS